MRKLFMLLAMMLIMALTVSTMAQGQQAMTRFRIVHLSPDGPVLMTNINGQPSGLQELSYPSMTGWIEIPADSAEISFTTQDAVDGTPLIGPITVDNTMSGWTTIAVVGSSENSTIGAYRLAEAFEAIPEGCAYVTVFHGMESGPTFDVSLEGGALLGAGLAFPNSAVLGTQAMQTVEGAEAPACDEAMLSAMTANPVQCFPIAVESAAEATETVSAEATAEAADTGAGTTGVNCAYSFLIPAGTRSFQFAEAGTQTSMLNLPNTQLNADTYYFISVAGTGETPQFYTFAVEEAALSGMMGGE